MKTRLLGLAFALTAVGALATSAAACTGIRIKANNGSIVYARTMEFGGDMQSNILVIPCETVHRHHGRQQLGSALDGQVRRRRHQWLQYAGHRRWHE